MSTCRIVDFLTVSTTTDCTRQMISHTFTGFSSPMASKAHYFRLDDVATVQIGSASPDYPRIDLITLRYDNSTPARSITLGVKAGTPAGTPHAPALERTDEVYEIALAVIGIEAAGTSIASFRDTRQDENYCGLVKSRFAIDGVPQPQTGVVPYGKIVPVIGGSFNAPAGVYEEV